MPPEELPPTTTPPAAPAPSPLEAASAAAAAAAATPDTPLPPADQPVDDQLPQGEQPPAVPEGEQPPAAPQGEEGQPAVHAIDIPDRFGQRTTLELQSPEQVETVQMLVNGYMRGEQARETVAAAQRELEAATEERLAFVADPVAVLERTPAAMRAMTVRNLLLDPAVQQELGDDLRLVVEHGAEAIKDRAALQRFQMRDQGKAQADEFRSAQAVARKIEGFLSAAINASPIAPENRDEAFNVLADLLASHEERTGKRIRNVEEARAIIAPRAKLFNIPLDDAAPAARPGARPPNGAPPAAPRRSVEDLKRGEATRIASGAAASTGRSAPSIPTSAPVHAPAGVGLKGATEHLRRTTSAAST